MQLKTLINWDGDGCSFPVYPILLNKLGVNEAILLCRICWWQKGEHEWVKKSVDEIQKQTGLKYKQQKLARENLVEKGIIQQEYHRLSHTLRFRILAEALKMEFEDEASAEREDGHLPKQEEASAVSADGICRKGSSSIEVLKSNKKESTFALIESETQEFQAAWDDWIAYRRERHLNCSKSTIKAQLAEFSAWGAARATIAIRAAIKGGWASCYPPKDEIGQKSPAVHSAPAARPTCFAYDGKSWPLDSPGPQASDFPDASLLATVQSSFESAKRQRA